ncbi:rap1 GTPase-GDP dissociation stimulator 1 isoform X2 [Paramuricea clavata]|uniref:Rap1 GTPase-GDP dissociation stimulator 1 isoform X2 n=1 Tax=Paramuricea clavata TaxID=317549 RepID=A0A6S7H3K7_PARCT|nr:rap1 GTPase-GDP dissociation stimulator 1 isoform X2 [Paramuricea clavata]
MDNLSDLLEKLRIFLSGEEISNNDDQHPPDVGLVRTVLEALKQNEDVLPGSEIQKILPLLKSNFEADDLNLKATLLELTAEICKSEDTRQLCVDAGLIPCIINCIETQHPAVVLQIFRAIGNIACDNNKAREEILEAGGVEKILNKLKELQNEEAKHNYETGHHVTACGAVLNLSFDNETLQRDFIQSGAIPLLLRYVEDNMNDSKLSLMATNAVSCLLDMDEGVSSFIATRGCEIFVKALKLSSGELTISLAECLRALSEEDGIKQALVSENCVDILQEIVSTNTSSNNKDVLEKLKISVDLIILLLGDDICLGELFAEENNIFIDKILLWTQSTEAYVRNSCPVAFGNIARTESNCIRLVKMEVHHKLIGLLRNNSQNTETDQIQLQVSVLSALKNLAIPASNKRVLIDAAALDCTLEFLGSSDTPLPLVFRATAVTRLLVQGQDAAVDTVCSQEQCIINLVSLAQDSGIEGLKSEASRLLATLLKNARKSESILAVVKNNGLLPVVTMVTSTHTTMQNEALVGIVLAVNVINNEYSHKIDESNLLATINSVLCAENAEPQTRYNSIAVIEALFIKGLVEKSKLEDSGILQNLETLTNHSHDAIKQRATTVINKIKNP